MKVWSGLFNIFALLIIAVMFIVFQKMYAVNERQFEEVRLQYASDYAALAAYRLALDEAHTQQTNYSDLEQVQISPEKINETYKLVMEKNYDQSESQYAEDMLNDSIITAVICNPWGYRLLEKVEYDSDITDAVIGKEYKNQWGILRPYIVYSKDFSRLFAANIVNDRTREYMTDEAWMQESLALGSTAIDGTTVRMEGVPVIKERTTYDGTTLTKEYVELAIATLLTEDINNEISKRVYSGAYGDIEGLYIPISESLSAINSIDKPTLLLVIQHSTYLNGAESSTSYSLSGVSAIAKTAVIGWTDEDSKTKFYCYAGQPLNPDGSLNTNIKIEVTFDTVEEAALAGYQPHYQYLTNPRRPTADVDYSLH